MFAHQEYFCTKVIVLSDIRTQSQWSLFSAKIHLFTIIQKTSTPQTEKTHLNNFSLSTPHFRKILFFFCLIHIWFYTFLCGKN